ncbi:hypothetical protein [Streptomyces olivochromogenes]|uniref:Uncharacterized protein n=1 Tax=Streptomyces olivochromogenes TaxID=1963 RepID=A0A250VSU7_STROL|nr:hypothetical protein [Streptomyces olivochromogenes]KUN38242.1 hypothetical protein AQJ27_44885 [Streptomyces olivochromogenes]GAX57318.1 hypothetical protein SO3561_08888 [Streptomyces olivochromogenes]
MESPWRTGETVLFGKSYCWVQSTDGKLSLHPVLKLSKARTLDIPFTWELAKAAVRRLAPRS